MKTFKKAGALLVAIVMTIVLGFTAMPASADDEITSYTITISNAQAGTTYSAYKIFDAVSGATTEGEKVSYYTLDTGTDNGSAIYAYMTEAETSSDLFTLTESGTEGIYYVQTHGSDITDTLVNYLKTMVQDLAESLTAAKPVENTADTTVTLDVGEAGYYFVTTNTEAAVMLTTANPTATIIDKEVVPGSVKKTISGAEIDDSIGGENHDATEAIGDYVDFTITANVPLYDAAESGAQEGRLVTKYVFTDTMDEGLEIRGLVEHTDYTIVYDKDENASYYATKDLLDSWIKITDETTGETYDLTEVAYDISMELIGTECTYLDQDGEEVTGIVFTGFILTYYTYDMSIYNSENTPDLATAAEIETEYPANASIAINYEVYVSEEASYENDNTITMNWYMTTFAEPFGPTDEDHPNRPHFPKRTPKNTPENPGDYEPSDEPDDEPEYPDPFNGTDSDEDEVYVLKLDILKIDGETGTSLKGAKFELTGKNLKEIVITTTEITDEDGNTTYEYEYGEKETDGYSVTGTTNQDGELEFSGLTIGEWTLKETEAPDGYNLVSSEYTIEISVTWNKNANGIYEPIWNVTVTDANGDAVADAFDDNIGTISLTVENYKGSLLPGTGGVGTTVFYVVGICLIVGAGVLLVTRKRVNRG